MKYDFGGVRMVGSEQGSVDNNWAGITKFKTGFAPNADPVQFPGSYDIILKPAKYEIYRFLQKIKRMF